MSKVEFGRTGEEIACKYLKENDYEIMERNFYYKGGEIDIIAFDKTKNEIVFFEVKTRANRKYGLPSESVDARKISHILKGIKYYVYKSKIENKFIRIDVVELYFKNGKFLINHIKQAI